LELKGNLPQVKGFPGADAKDLQKCYWKVRYLPRIGCMAAIMKKMSAFVRGGWAFLLYVFFCSRLVHAGMQISILTQLSYGTNDPIGLLEGDGCA
jgi:hypothetical protein